MTPSRSPAPKAEFTDIRFVIASALGLIGLFLVLCAVLVSNPEEMEKTGGINANLWSGLGLLVVAVGMGIWWRVNPAGDVSHHES